MNEKREFVMHSVNYAPGIHRVTGYYLSEKLDGMRALWIPWSVGHRAGNLDCFVNTDKSGADVQCTGLFSRYGRVIHCPSFVTSKLMDMFPDICVDGELYAGRGQWNTVTSICKKQGGQVSKEDWASFITYNIFDVPDAEKVFEPGRIKSGSHNKVIKRDACMSVLNIGPNLLSPYFDFRLRLLHARVPFNYNGEFLRSVYVNQLPFQNDVALQQMNKSLDEILDSGGEGIMLRHPSATWEPKRSSFLLKVKGTSDAEGRIIGYTTGNGKYIGMLGSVRVVLDNGIEFDLSGFTDEERRVVVRNDIEPDMYTTTSIVSEKFPIGAVVTFTFRELSPLGKPKEARYLRRRIEE